jgi:hypothetical protein
MRHIYVSILVLLCFQPLLPQDRKPYHSSMVSLGNLLGIIAHSDSRSSISRERLDSLVSYFRFQEYLCDSGHHNDWTPAIPDSADDWTFPCFNNLVKYSREDTAYISVLIRLQQTIACNAELAEATTPSVEDAAQGNPEGFLLVYQKLNQSERDALVHHPDWGLDIDVRRVFTEFAHATTNESLRQLANELAKTGN